MNTDFNLKLKADGTWIINDINSEPSTNNWGWPLINKVLTFNILKISGENSLYSPSNFNKITNSDPSVISNNYGTGFYNEIFYIAVATSSIKKAGRTTFRVSGNNGIYKDIDIQIEPINLTLTYNRSLTYNASFIDNNPIKYGIGPNFYGLTGNIYSIEGLSSSIPISDLPCTNWNGMGYVGCGDGCACSYESPFILNSSNSGIATVSQKTSLQKIWEGYNISELKNKNWRLAPSYGPINLNSSNFIQYAESRADSPFRNFNINLYNTGVVDIKIIKTGSDSLFTGITKNISLNIVKGDIGSKELPTVLGSKYSIMPGTIQTDVIVAPWPNELPYGLASKNEELIKLTKFQSSDLSRAEISSNGVLKINPNADVGSFYIYAISTGNHLWNEFTGVIRINLQKTKPLLKTIRGSFRKSPSYWWSELSEWTDQVTFPVGGIIPSVLIVEDPISTIPTIPTPYKNLYIGSGVYDPNFKNDPRFNNPDLIFEPVKGAYLTYTSSNPSVATVNSTGLATILSAGSTNITVNFLGTNQYEPVSRTIVLDVVKERYNLSVKQGSFNKNISENSFNLEVTVPENKILVSNSLGRLSSNGYVLSPIQPPNNLIYTSLDTGIVQVNQAGLVSIVGTGKTSIEISQDETPLFESSRLLVPINISRSSSLITVPNNNYTKLITDNPFNLNATSNNTEVPLVYTSSDSSIATVDSNGLVTILKNGPVNIVISQNSNSNWDQAVSKTVNIIINKLPSILNFPLINSKFLNSPPFNLTVTSNNNNLIYYKSNNSGIATVNSTGLVNILNTGQTSIEAYQTGDNILLPVSVTQNLIVAAPILPKFITGEQIIISNNNNYNGLYLIREIAPDGKHYLECIPDCAPEPIIDVTLSGPEIYSNFGWCIDINGNGNTLVVGTPKENYELKKNVGFVYVYNRYGNSNSWYLNTRLSGAKLSKNFTNFGNFGQSVAINSGNIIVVGMPFYRPFSQEFLPFNGGLGAVRVFNLNGSNWSGQNILSADSGSQFGFSVDINDNGDTLAIGAPLNITNGQSKCGKVYIYTGSIGNWSLTKILSGVNNYGYFGSAVKLNSGNKLLIAENNSTHLYNFNNNNWELEHTFYKSTADINLTHNNFNKFIDINKSGNYVLVGCPYQNLYGSTTLYKKQNNTWVQANSFTGDYNYNYFGASVGLDTNKNIISIGAPDENQVYIYTGENFVFSGRLGYNAKNKRTNELCPSSFSGLGNSIAVHEDSNFVGFSAYFSSNDYSNSSSYQNPVGKVFVLKDYSLNSSSSSSSSSNPSSSSSSNPSSSSSSNPSSSSSSNPSSSSSSSVIVEPPPPPPPPPTSSSSSNTPVIGDGVGDPHLHFYIQTNRCQRTVLSTIDDNGYQKDTILYFYGEDEYGLWGAITYTNRAITCPPLAGGCVISNVKKYGDLSSLGVTAIGTSLSLSCSIKDLSRFTKIGGLWGSVLGYVSNNHSPFHSTRGPLEAGVDQLTSRAGLVQAATQVSLGPLSPLVIGTCVSKETINNLIQIVNNPSFPLGMNGGCGNIGEYPWDRYMDPDHQEYDDACMETLMLEILNEKI